MKSEVEKIGQGVSLRPVQVLLAEWFDPLTAAIRDEQLNIKYVPDKIVNSRQGKGAISEKAIQPYLLLLKPDKIAIIVLHELAHILMQSPAGNAYTFCCENVGKIIKSEAIAKLENDKKRRAKKGEIFVTAPLPDTDLVYSRNRCYYQTDWAPDITYKVGGVLLFLLQKNCFIKVDGKVGIPKMLPSQNEPAFIHFYRRQRPSGNLIGMFRFNEAVQQKLDQGDSRGEISFIRYKPMLVPPRPWLSVDRGGFISQKTVFMRTHGSKLQSDCLYQADLTDVFRSLNILGKVGWVINKDVLKVAEAVWERGGGELDIPSRTDLKMPEQVCFFMEFQKQSDFDNERSYRRAMMKIKQKNYDLHSLRCDLGYKLDIAREFQNDVDSFRLVQEQVIYFPMNLDFRGRVYPIPPHLNHLGNDLCRGLLSFARRKRLGERGLFWLKIQIANLYGNDKVS